MIKYFFYICSCVFLFSFLTVAMEFAGATERSEGIYLFGGSKAEMETDEQVDGFITAVLKSEHHQKPEGALTITYPFDHSIFPPEITAPAPDGSAKETPAVQRKTGY